MKCPFCGCQSFYLKDQDDEYETYEFDVKKGEVNFNSEVNESDVPELGKRRVVIATNVLGTGCSGN